jgi:flagellar hook-associated protein FlgK
LQQAQTQLSPSSGSLSDLLSNFFDQAEQLSSDPNDPTQLSTFVDAAQSLAQGLNTASQNLTQLQQSLDSQGQQSVATANGLTTQIASLNSTIQNANAQGTDVNDLEDQRDELISQLAGIVNVQTIPQGQGVVNVIAGGVPVVMGSQATALQYNTDGADNPATVSAAGSTTAASISGGSLGGLLSARNQGVSQLQGQLNSLTQQLVSNVNEIQATGIPSSGSYSLLTGENAVTSVTAPLAKAGLASPPQAGTLSVTVVNQATGAQTLTQIAIDPSTESLQDVATALSAVPHLQAVVNTQSNTLTVMAQPGYTFNFAGQLPATPSTQAITGTSTPQFSGTYTGTTNDNYTFTVSGSGTVGVTPNLSLQVTNSAGNLLGTYNIGQGYSPGTAIPTLDGVNVQMSSGTLNNGDSFSTPVVANSDSGNILSSLGLNSFFTGDSAANVQVQPGLLSSPQSFATSLTGEAGDSSNIQRLSQLANTNLLAGGTQTLQQYFASTVGNLGAQVQNLTSQQTAQQTVNQQLQTQQQGVSGVDTNQQLIQMVQYQQSYQMAAQYISSVTTAFNYLLNYL